MHTMKSVIAAIIYKQLQKEMLSTDELAIYNEWIAESPENEQMLHALIEEKEWDRYFEIRTSAERNEKAWTKFSALIELEPSAKAGAGIKKLSQVHQLRKWWWAAACILFAAMTVIYFNLKPSESTMAPVVAQKDSETIQPGKDGAILTLADGNTVSLDSVKNGVVALQGGSKARLVNGSLIYEGKSQEALFNTMSTPKGRQFQMILPDGTAVWLNAASSIRYPVVFNGTERKVAVTGEVYFEVKKDSKPFIVSAENNTEIKVLGTSFNINSYQNEGSIKATLLQGAVKVSHEKQNCILKPGEQADVQEMISVKKGVDLEAVIAWRYGLFNFENVPLEEVMRQVERWYDIEVLYENGIPAIELDGKITRGVTLNELLKGLQELGLRTQLKGRQLKVLAGKP